MPRPRPESSFQLCPCPVACILSAFICQINSQKGKPNLRFETISAGKVRTTNPPPEGPPYIYPSAKSYIQKDSPFALFCSTASAAAAVVCPAGSCRHLSSAQLCSASTQFVTIPFCGLIFALLVSLSYLALPSPLSLTQSLPGCAFICLVALPDLACLLFVLFVSALYLN